MNSPNFSRREGTPDDVLSPSLERSSRRSQRFLLRYFSRGCGSCNRVRSVVDFWEFRHPKIDLTQNRPAHPQRRGSATSGRTARWKTGHPYHGWRAGDRHCLPRQRALGPPRYSLVLLLLVRLVFFGVLGFFGDFSQVNKEKFEGL